IAGVHDLRRQEQRDNAVLRGECKGAFEEDDGQMGLMKGGPSAATRAAKKRIAFGAHPFRSLIDATVANPRRIADHDIEATVGHDVREVDVEGKEIELTVLDTFESAPVIRDATMQLATTAQVHRAF